MCSPPQSICPFLVSYYIINHSSTDKETACNAGDTGDSGSICGLGRSPGERNGNSLQYSCLENFMKRGAWRTIVHGVAKSRTCLTAHTHVNSTGDSAQCSAMIYMGKESKKRVDICVYIHIYMIHFGVQQKLTHYKSTVVQ